MQRIILILLSSLLMSCTAHYKNRIKVEGCENGYTYVPNENNKNILVFTSRGGHGHTSAAEAITNLLGKEYNVEVVNIFDLIMPDLDPAKHALFGNIFSDKVYNEALSRGWNNTINLVTRYYARRKFAKQSKLIGEVIGHYYCKAKPSMVISLLPYVNKGIMLASEKSKVPFVIVGVDAELTNYFIGFKPGQIDDKLLLTVPFEMNLYSALFEKMQFPKDQIEVTGLPLRKGFTKHLPKRAMRQKLNLPTEQFNILLLMGGAGSPVLKSYVKEIAKANTKAHLVVITGRNHKLAEKIRQIELPAGLTMDVLGYTKDVAEYMAAADVLITKPGPTTIAEAIALDLPLILDRTVNPLIWEEPLFHMVTRNHLGIVSSDWPEFIADLNKMIDDKSYFKGFRSSIKKYHLGNFNKKFLEVFNKAQNMYESRSQ